MKIEWDPNKSIGEFRYVTFGMSAMGRVLVISHTDTSETIRIIRARVASKGERKVYEEG
jgi:uncharacterized protein